MALLFPGLVLFSDWRPTRRYYATSGNEVMFISKNTPSKSRGGRPSSVARTNGSRKQYSAQVSENRSGGIDATDAWLRCNIPYELAYVYTTATTRDLGPTSWSGGLYPNFFDKTH